MMQTETPAGDTSTTAPNSISVVIVRHPFLASTDRRVWKPFYKRLCGIAGLKGYPLYRGLPGPGWSHFDGKRFRSDFAEVAFEFSDWKKHNRFIEKLKRIENIRAQVRSKPIWFEVCSKEW